MYNNNSTFDCESCGIRMSRGNALWHFVCKSCGLERSSLIESINSANDMKEGLREDALKPIRQKNFRILLKWMDSLLSAPDGGNKKTILDVGCAHGWFIEMASKDYYVLGLEPDKNVANKAKKSNLNIRNGFFPADLRSEEVFDVIIFNDVLEHIPNVSDVLIQCQKKISRGGMIVVNAPNSYGIFYRLSKVLLILGFHDSFDRMWQVGLPSPHLYYFNDKSFKKIADRAGFEIVSSISLPSILTKGLYSRISFASNKSKTQLFLLWIAILFLIPLARLLPSDTSAWALKQRAS